MRLLSRSRFSILATVAMGLLVAACGGRSGSGEAGAAVTPGTVLSVSDFMQKHQADRAPRTVEGFVDTVAAKEGIVGLTNCTEGEFCSDEACKLTLPVRWTGPLPTVGQRVRVVGSVEQGSGGKVFVATKTGLAEVP